MDSIKFPCDCGRMLRPIKLGYLTKDQLIEMLKMQSMPDALLNPIKPENNKRLSLKELIEVLKLRIRPIKVACRHCHKVTDLNEKLAPERGTLTAKSYEGVDKNRYLGGFPSFNG